MEKYIIIPARIVTADKDKRILDDHFIEINKDKIKNIAPLDDEYFRRFEGEIYKYPELTLIPGFIQPHVHLCQTLFRGLADELELLDWLSERIMPMENAHNTSSLRISSELGLYELLKTGTTAICDMGTLRYQEQVFEAIEESGIRAFAGKCMMDENDLMPEFKNSTDEELKITRKLAEKYHNTAEGRIKYAFAPRFVLSCSEELLKGTLKMSEDFPGSLYHTHSSENKSEIKEVKQKTGMENVEYLHSLGLLKKNCVLAHCIHLNEDEKEILLETGTGVAHCPSSNMKLGSGIAPIPDYLKQGIKVSIAADGAPCNNSMDMFSEMRLASMIQKPVHGPTAMTAEEVFTAATIGGARVLNIDDYTGSIEPGKKADMVLLDLSTPEYNMRNDKYDVYGDIVYSGKSSAVRHVFVDGVCLVKDGEPVRYDAADLSAAASRELKHLTLRMEEKRD